MNDDFTPSGHDVEVFNPAAFIGDGMGAMHEGVLISRQVAELLGKMDQPRTEIWLCAHADATRDKLDRLAAEGVIVRRKPWLIGPAYWHRTQKGTDWHDVWSREMDRRRERGKRGPFLDRELDQIPDNATFQTFESSATGMSGTLIQVPHDPVARDVPYDPPADMVSALGLLSEHEITSVDRLVGQNDAPTTADRMGGILTILQRMGLAVPRGHGWARTMMGTRMHVTWTMPKEPT